MGKKILKGFFKGIFYIVRVPLFGVLYLITLVFKLFTIYARPLIKIVSILLIIASIYCIVKMKNTFYGVMLIIIAALVLGIFYFAASAIYEGLLNLVAIFSPKHD